MENKAPAQNPSVPQPAYGAVLAQCSALSAAPRLPFEACLFCEGNEVLFGNYKNKNENKLLVSLWFCLYFVNQSLWAGFQVAEATLEQLQKHNTKMSV